MLDGSDAIADWPILNAQAQRGQRRVVGELPPRRRRRHRQLAARGEVIVADGTAAAAKRLERCSPTTPGIGVARHADAGYEIALKTAEATHIRLPMREG